jgi:hypothetical protein
MDINEEWITGRKVYELGGKLGFVRDLSNLQQIMYTFI